MVLESGQIRVVVEDFTKGTGFINVSELESLWETLGLAASHKNINAVRRELVEDGKVSSDALLAWWFDDKATMAKVESKLANDFTTIDDSKVREVFDRVDTDGNGTISFREFCFAMEELGLDWSIDVAKATFKEIDENKNKRLEFDEFRHALHTMNADRMEVFWTRLFQGGPPPDVAPTEEKEETFTVASALDLVKDKEGDWRR